MSAAASTGHVSHGATGAGAEEISYQVATSTQMRTNAFRLVYEAYVRARLINSNPFRIRVTPYHLLDTTDIFVAVLRGEVISTVTLVCDGELGLPMESIYAEEVRALRAEGIRFAEVSALADRRRQMSRTLPVFVKLMRLMAQFARHQGVDQLLIAVHPRHARFYTRFLDFKPLGGVKSYPTVLDNPAVALMLDLSRMKDDHPQNYSTFFGHPIPADQLRRRPMTEMQKRSFASAAELGKGFMLVGSGDDSGDSTTVPAQDAAT